MHVRTTEVSFLAGGCEHRAHCAANPDSSLDWKVAPLRKMGAVFKYVTVTHFPLSSLAPLLDDSLTTEKVKSR